MTADSGSLFSPCHVRICGKQASKLLRLRGMLGQCRQGLVASRKHLFQFVGTSLQVQQLLNSTATKHWKALWFFGCS